MASDDTSNNTTVQIWPSFQLNAKSPPLLLHNSTDEGKKVFEHLEHDVVQA